MPAEKKYLLLQIRHNPEVCAEEYQCFLQHCGLAEAQLDVFNIYQHTEFSAEILQGYSALLVGGASEANVLEPEKYAFVTPAVALLKYCAAVSFPVFASCYGFQLAVLALDGAITDNSDCQETGTIPLTLSAAAATDPIFTGLPDQFKVVSVHQQSAVQLPAGCTLLASTTKCLHAFRLTDKPFWAFQFHPEVNRKILIERLTRYQEYYTKDARGLNEVLSSVVETPESNSLPQRFIQYLQAEPTVTI
ncbi:MAG: type 1 glutamine amidotransferase [Xanthomonadales bacterium]|nr:type 1 glutamine amidotransferase [Xanthomonadales bacterium]